MRINRSAASVGMFLMIATLSACGSDDKVPTFVAAVPKSLAVASGNNQSGFVTTTLDTAISVMLTDANGLPVVGSRVAFKVTGGGGTVSVDTTSTDAYGLAETTWTLGDAAGPQSVSVTSVATPSATGSFTATAAAPTYAVESGNNQTAPATDTLPEPLKVLVTDGNSAPVQGVRVDFAVTSGGGFFATADSATTTSVLTDKKGEAAIQWILGPSVGPQTATAKVGTGDPVTFDAIAQ